MIPRALILEDDPDIALIERELIGVSGIDVTTASTVDEALEMLGGAAFDVAVVDLQLPGRSGWEFIECARASHPGMPLVIYSVHADQPELVAKAVTVGATVVSKSDDPLRLVDAVTSLLASPAAP